ncbi:MAG: hypothetical protein HRU03_00040 [Nanoarchaeales archaeon]|nr:hypothetical protein [Nanoarchaeales archaeon]
METKYMNMEEYKQLLWNAIPVGLDLYPDYFTDTPIYKNVKQPYYFRNFIAEVNNKPVEGKLENIVYFDTIMLVDYTQSIGRLHYSEELAEREEFMKRNDDTLDLTFIQLDSKIYNCPIQIPFELIGKNVKIELEKVLTHFRSSAPEIRRSYECSITFRNDENKKIKLKSGLQPFTGISLTYFKKEQLERNLIRYNLSKNK